MATETTPRQSFNSLIEAYNRAISPNPDKLKPKKRGGEHESVAWYVNDLFLRKGPDAASEEIEVLKTRFFEIESTIPEVSERRKELRILMSDRVYTAYDQALKRWAVEQKGMSLLSTEEALKKLEEEGELTNAMDRVITDDQPLKGTVSIEMLQTLFRIAKLWDFCLPTFGAVHATLTPEWYNYD